MSRLNYHISTSISKNLLKDNAYPDEMRRAVAFQLGPHYFAKVAYPFTGIQRESIHLGSAFY